jgi:hypothetical protein
MCGVRSEFEEREAVCVEDGIEYRNIDTCRDK